MKVKQLNMALVGIVLSFTSAATAHSIKHEPVISDLPASPFTVLTTQPNGDLNPYGVAFVPKHFAPGGPLHPGDIIVSNFNGSTNVQGTGTTIISVSPERIPEGGFPIVVSETQLASGYLIRTDPAALVVGPTGLAFDAEKDILYVASTGDNEIFAIASARKRTTDVGNGNLVYQA